MSGHFCIGFIDFMLKGKKLTDFTSLFSPYDFQKNDDIILRGEKFIIYISNGSASNSKISNINMR